MSEPELLVTIDNVVYDLSTFKNFHPGGKLILEQYHKKDATDAFNAFHGKEGHERLRNMKGTPVKEQSALDPKIRNFRILRQKFKDDGLFEPNYLWQFYKCSSSVALFVLGVYLTSIGHWAMGAVLFGIGYQQMGWLGHDACHHGLTPNRKFNNFLGYVFGNLFSGFSVNWWKDRHNTHHAITNVLESDPDVDNLPLFVWSELEVPKWKLWPGMARTIIPYQHLYFIPWTVTLKLIWCLQSAFFVRNLEIQNKSYLKSLPAERWLLVLHYIFLFFVLRLTPSIGAAVLFYLISEFIGGAGIALIVFMNHYSLEQIEKEKALSTDFLGLQLLGTKNINPGVFMDWFAGGLNYQVEHHLFPTIPRHNLSKVKPLVEKFCKENDLPYQSETYYGCISAVLSKLKATAAVYNKATEGQSQK